ncbi:cardiac-enriched FHL2-interacting protein [Ranitomeya variabilis]|uniref:cardiac-enriched FHL2-interacting protein n=1 Tax=Ranitomeya variabilis TaxID=490064 RepID=UPI004057C51D
MLRYKKNKRQADGLGTSVSLMDDTDREVSSFTDRAFRSLCVAEEEPFNDVPHVPSPIKGMSLSTKYHLGIFNLSVRKTQPLAQLPTTPRQRGKWAPTFQPLLTYAKIGVTDVKTNNSKLFAPVPRGSKQCSKVSSLIQTFDNIENEIPDNSPLDSRLILSKGCYRDIEANAESETVKKTYISNELIPESINPDDNHLNDNNLHRRTAREVFLESQTETCSRLSRSPLLSSGSPLADQAKKVIKHKDSLRRTAFLHSEHSAFKSWSDINRRMVGGDESDSSIPGTPPLPRSATPCSPLLQRAISGLKARDGVIELGWTSPASSVSSSYDPNQMLRTVPPLPTRKNAKQNRDSYQKAARTLLNVRNQDMIKTDEGHSSSKEQVNWMNKMNKSKSPEQVNHVASPNNASALNNASQIFVRQKEEGHSKIISPEHIEMSEATSKEELKEQEKKQPPPGKLKTLIQQIEKESIKEIKPVHFTEKKYDTRNFPKDESVEIPTTIEKSLSSSNNLSGSSNHVPPWRKTKSSNKIAPEKIIRSKSVTKKETVAVHAHENIYLCKEVQEEKPSTFNISNLLTPVIRRKNIQEALEENSIITAPINIASKDQDQRELLLYQKRDDYKSKATSLLFNLKDMRKRVKSTYSPAITARNGFENNLMTDVKMQESVIHANNVPDINRLFYEAENHTYFEENLRLTGESEFKSKLVGNESENYLSLSPMDQITSHQNGELSEEKVISDANFIQEEKEGSQFLRTNNNHIHKEIDHSPLNLHSKTDTFVGGESTMSTEDSLTCLNNTEVHCLSGMENVEEIKHDECTDGVSDPGHCVMETSVDIVPKQSKTFFPSEDIESKWDADHHENEKQVSNDDESKEILQYFAVNSCSGVDGIESNVKFGVLESQIEKEECQENVTFEKARAESSCSEELKRPSSITPFKPNLFYLKDNKIKSSPITKSVRLPLFRSLSEDCLAFKKLDDTYSWKIGDFKDARESKGIGTDILKTKHADISNVSKHQKHLEVSLAEETPKHKAMEHNQVQTYKEEAEDQKLWRNVSSIRDDKTKNEVEESTAINMANRSKMVPCLEETFFHPVETCVSEVTGLSPECNTLIVHNIRDSTKELVNGEHIGSPCIHNENTIDSPIDNGILQFEDSVSFIEDIACSNITSPMSESVTCSIVASPMSVNTQSSGFTTALSALEDIPSPPSTSVNTRNGKFNFLHPERVIPLDSESKSTHLVKQEKGSVIEPQKMHAKPPAVPPKTEKALRRAKRLTKKRRKTDMPQRDFLESDVALDVSAPGNLTPTLVSSQSHHKLMSCTPRSLEHEDIMSESSTQSLPLTQRKLLLDPDSGRYFMVDIPVCLRIKTFYDPETGKYLQMSLPPSERGNPAFEMSNSPYMMYPGLTPVPVSSIVSYKGKSELLNHENVNTCERENLWNDKEEDSLKMDNFKNCDSHDQKIIRTPLSMDRITSRSSDIISMKDIDDFAMEAVS